MQLGGGAQPDSPPIRGLTGYETGNGHILDQRFQEELSLQHFRPVGSLPCNAITETEDDMRYGSISKQAQQTNGHFKPCSPGNSIIQSRGNNGKGRTTSANESTDVSPPHNETSSSSEYLWPADDAIRWMKTKPSHKSEFFHQEQRLREFHTQLNGRDHVSKEERASSVNANSSLRNS